MLQAFDFLDVGDSAVETVLGSCFIRDLSIVNALSYVWKGRTLSARRRS